jgi:hypothetical protein
VQVFMVAERSLGRSQREVIDVEALAHALHHGDQPGMRERVADAHAGERVGLAEGAGDDQVRMPRQGLQRRFEILRIDQFGIGLVDNHDDSARHARHEGCERIRGEPGPGRVVRIGEIQQARRGRDRGEQRVEVMTACHRALARVSLCQPEVRARCLRSDRVDRKSILRGDDIDVRPREHLRELHQQFVRTIAEHDVRDIDAVMACEGAPEVATERIGVAMQRMQSAEHRFARARTGAVGILVGTEFDEVPGGELAAQRDQVMAGIVGAQPADARLRQRREKLLADTRPRCDHGTATGYEPSTRTSPAKSSTSAKASRNGDSSAWPPTSMKKAYCHRPLCAGRDSMRFMLMPRRAKGSRIL